MFRDYIFTLIFNDRPMISFGTRKIDKITLILLAFPCNNTAGTLIVKYRLHLLSFILNAIQGG
jgi:hypothetical protein